MIGPVVLGLVDRFHGQLCFGLVDYGRRPAGRHPAASRAAGKKAGLI